MGVSDEEEKKFKVNLGSMLQIIEHTSTPDNKEEEDEDTGEDELLDDSVIVGIDN